MSKLIDFQKVNGLSPDGDLGRFTLDKMKVVLNIPKKEHLAHYVGQCAHESSQFTKSKENLNYSVEGLMATFGRHRISEADCVKYGRTSKQRADQVAIGNIIYGGEWGRINLGNTEPGDGYKFRGHGPLHLTGRGNFEAFAEFVNDPCVVENPNLIITKYYFESALFFFNANNIWKHCDRVNASTILAVSRAVNLGNAYSKGKPNHLKERIIQTEKFYKILTAQ